MEGSHLDYVILNGESIQSFQCRHENRKKLSQNFSIVFIPNLSPGPQQPNEKENEKKNLIQSFQTEVHYGSRAVFSNGRNPRG